MESLADVIDSTCSQRLPTAQELFALLAKLRDAEAGLVAEQKAQRNKQAAELAATVREAADTAKSLQQLTKRHASVQSELRRHLDSTSGVMRHLAELGEDIAFVQREQAFSDALQRCDRLVAETRTAIERTPLAAIEPFLSLFEIYETVCVLSLSPEQLDAARAASPLSVAAGHRPLMATVASMPSLSAALRQTAKASQLRASVLLRQTTAAATTGNAQAPTTVHADAAKLRGSLRSLLVEFGAKLTQELSPLMDTALVTLYWPQSRRALLSTDANAIGGFARLFAAAVLLQFAGSCSIVLLTGLLTGD